MRRLYSGQTRHAINHHLSFRNLRVFPLNYVGHPFCFTTSVHVKIYHVYSNLLLRENSKSVGDIGEIPTSANTSCATAVQCPRVGYETWPTADL